MLTVVDDLDHFYLDVKGIDVKSVELLLLLGSEEMWTEVEFKIEEPNPDIGQALLVVMPEPLIKKSKVNIRVHYSTNQNSTAINWLTAD